MDHNAETVQLCKVFKLEDVFPALEQNLLVLSGEVVVHLVDACDEISPGAWQFC